MNNPFWFSPLQQKRQTVSDKLKNESHWGGCRLGVLGAGQLAWMLAQAARDLGIEVSVFAEKPHESAILAGFPWSSGNFADSSHLEQFSRTVDLVLIESELIPFDPLEKALDISQTPIIPSLGCLQVARDKLLQKKLFDRLKLPTARWTEIPELSGDKIDSFFQDLLGIFTRGFVLKWSLGGYDGKGVLAVRFEDWDASVTNSKRDLLRERILVFLEKAQDRRIPVYAEEYIPYRGECALTVTVTEKDRVFYPLVLSQQDQGTCWQIRPLRGDSQLDAHILEAKAQGAASKVASELGIRGTFALEFFMTSDGDLVLNEMAPRVHNSCHYSQIAGHASQFHNHIRAACDLSLEKPQLPLFYGMTNILGPESYEGPIIPPDLLPFYGQNFINNLNPESPLSSGKLQKGSSYHWYDKATSSTRRKLGHINSWANTPQEFTNELQHVEKILIQWKQKYAT